MLPKPIELHGANLAELLKRCFTAWDTHEHVLLALPRSFLQQPPDELRAIVIGLERRHEEPELFQRLMRILDLDETLPLTTFVFPRK